MVRFALKIVVEQTNGVRESVNDRLGLCTVCNYGKEIKRISMSVVALLRQIKKTIRNMLKASFQSHQNDQSRIERARRDERK